MAGLGSYGSLIGTKVWRRDVEVVPLNQTKTRPYSAAEDQTI